MLDRNEKTACPYLATPAAVYIPRFFSLFFIAPFDRLHVYPLLPLHRRTLQLAHCPSIHFYYVDVACRFSRDLFCDIYALRNVDNYKTRTSLIGEFILARLKKKVKLMAEMKFDRCLFLLLLKISWTRFRKYQQRCAAYPDEACASEKRSQRESHATHILVRVCNNPAEV